MTLRAIPLLILIAAGPACREECEETACQAAQAPRSSSKIAQGVTGVIAYRTDACVAEDCCECSWDQAEFSVWRSDQPIGQEEARVLLAGEAPALVFSAKRVYEQALDPGEYLLCHHVSWAPTACAALRIERGEVFTVNLQMRYGPASLIVFGPGDRAAREDLVFRVERPEI